jgi:hypothetical protein
MSPQKHPDAERTGGPGASHENRKHPDKSKPHGELPHADAGSGNRATREQDKRMGEPAEFSSDEFAGRTDAGGDHRTKKPMPGRDKS